ncbi:MAG: nucleotidyl transferase AbiEii/AbiGii toxin family protein [Proteobacteria bacterium]|nr:nucleotidyl transferase AbiEii/AbiGii toxin family protein [Pseudomonadota bacterium]
MPADFLHNHKQFKDLIRIVAADKGIDPALVEKDYWIMHCLWGLKRLGFAFELKGGTSLSKGFKIIDRFSEDIDIRIEPPKDQNVKTGKNHTKHAHIESRRAFYGWLAATIKIDGIAKVERDTEFDNATLMSGGIRLFYTAYTAPMPDLKDGVLLEAGFDDVSPNTPQDISSWMYDHASPLADIIDNRARAVLCYDPCFTFVEKLQTISTKFRQQQQTNDSPRPFMRHYYDVRALLKLHDVQTFIGTDAYHAHKAKRFRGGDNPVIASNEAFRLSGPAIRAVYKEAFRDSTALYYAEKPTLDDVLAEIAKSIDRL